MPTPEPDGARMSGGTPGRDAAGLRATGTKTMKHMAGFDPGAQCMLTHTQAHPGEGALAAAP